MAYSSSLQKRKLHNYFISSLHKASSAPNNNKKNTQLTKEGKTRHSTSTRWNPSKLHGKREQNKVQQHRATEHCPLTSSSSSVLHRLQKAHHLGEASHSASFPTGRCPEDHLLPAGGKLTENSVYFGKHLSFSVSDITIKQNGNCNIATLQYIGHT